MLHFTSILAHFLLKYHFFFPRTQLFFEGPSILRYTLGWKRFLTCPKRYSGVSRKFTGGNEGGFARLFCVLRLCYFPLACHT